MSSRATLLIIEDVNFAREAMVSMFARLNCEVGSAANGRAALEKIATKAYDLIVVDLDLADMEGLTVVETVRNSDHERALDVPMVALTAYHQAFFREKAMACGMNDLTAKPLTFDMAEQLIRKWVKQPATT